MISKPTPRGAEILVIEAERAMRQFLRAALVSHGYRMTEAANGSAGVRQALRRDPEIVVLGLGLSDMDGIEVIRQIRIRSPVPILVTSARDRTVGGVVALNAGANDYLRKPFGANELLRRIESLLRFTHRRPNDADDAEFATDHLYVNCRQRRVFVDDQEIELSPTEYGILYSLILHAGSPVTMDQLRNEQGPSGRAADEFQLRSAVTQLHRKLGGKASPPRFILTEPGIGYRLEVN